jgi:hypothetical protein
MGSDAVASWLSSIGPGAHDVPSLAALWLSMGNTPVATAQLGRWLGAAGFQRTRTGKAKITRYLRPPRRVDAEPTPAAAHVDAVYVVKSRPEMDAARLLAWRFVRALPCGTHELSKLFAEFGEWLDCAGVDAISERQFAGWLAVDGCEVDAELARMAA